MSRTPQWLFTTVLIGIAIALLVGACGGSRKKAGSVAPVPDGSAPTVAAADTRTFPIFRIATDPSIDYLDPGLTYTIAGSAVLWNAYLPLVGYKHVNGPDGATIVPYLARALPKVSSDGKTYTLALRTGLEYSNGQAVKASDFAYAIERVFQLDSPGAAFFRGIVGADSYAKTKRGHIAGIVTNDSTGQITIHLIAPQGDFDNILATEFAAPVPAGTPAKDQSTAPIPSTGPYMIKKYAPDNEIVEVRNPHFDAAVFDGQVPAGHPDEIVWNIVGSNEAALERVIAGKDDWDGFHAIPADKLASVRRRYHGEIKSYIQPNTYYFFMNTRVAPFTSLDVRRAVNYAIDRKELVRLYGGLAVPTENIIPPTNPQYAAHRFYPHDLARARRLVARSGFKGAHVTVWCPQFGTDVKASKYLVAVLRAIGFHADERIVSSAAYWSTIGKEATKAQIGFADWFQDYPHPLDWFDVLLNGTRITKTNNSDYANFDDPAVNAKIDALKRQPRLTRAVNGEWAAVDGAIMRQAPWVPFLNRQFIDFFSRRVDLSCYVNQVVYGFDYATACVR